MNNTETETIESIQAEIHAIMSVGRDDESMAKVYELQRRGRALLGKHSVEQERLITNILTEGYGW